MKDLNVTKNINIIESLKSSALYKIADIYRCQDDAGSDKSEDTADMIILLYLLADKMGCSFSEIDKTIVKHLKDAIKGEKSEWRDELKLLLRHFE